MWRVAVAVASVLLRLSQSEGPEGSILIQSLSEEVYLAAFEDFVRRFDKHYSSDQERSERFAVFRANYDSIQERNRQGNSYRLGVTRFADLTQQEFSRKFGMPTSKRSNVTMSSRLGAPKLGWHQVRGVTLPPTVDWRSQHAVAAVQNQGQCGACWTFAAAGAMEGAAAIQRGNLAVSLSEQQLLDCVDEQFGNHGCEGGSPEGAFYYTRTTNLCTAMSYRYQAVRGKCQLSGPSNCEVGLPKGALKGYKNVDANSDHYMMDAVAQQPVAVAIEADSMVFQLYHSGVIRGPSCYGQSHVDHGVLLIGYGTDSSLGDYWIIKNSWGTEWGESGFGRLARGQGIYGECGILTDGSYPVIDFRPPPIPPPPIPGVENGFRITPVMILACLWACVCLCVLMKNFCKGRWQSRQSPLLPAAQVRMPQPAPPAAVSEVAAIRRPLFLPHACQ